MLADVVTIIGTLDLVFGECGVSIFNTFRFAYFWVFLKNYEYYYTTFV